MELTVTEAVNRGFNLLACGTLGLSGLAFGTIVLEEKDLTDKVDDGGFLLIGAIAVIWYLIGRNRFKRTPVPLVLAAVALVVQLVGLVLERNDSAAVGDNIGGLWLFVPLLVLLAVQYYRHRVHQGTRLASTQVPIG
ncbi:MAG TPA: hypothetical protein VIP78_02900 [Candidatus Dormibacteraeota bacterium]|jgi:hypothetical protein